MSRLVDSKQFLMSGDTFRIALLLTIDIFVMLRQVKGSGLVQTNPIYRLQVL